MKKLWINALLSAMFISISIFVFAERKEKEVKIEDMPQSVQQFIATHFDKEVIIGARIVKYGYHKVMLSNGYEALFDRQGRWLEIDNEKKLTLPASTFTLLPQSVLSYLSEKFPNSHICGMKHNKKGYEIEVSGVQHMNVSFDNKGNYINQTID